MVRNRKGSAAIWNTRASENQVKSASGDRPVKCQSAMAMNSSAPPSM